MQSRLSATLFRFLKDEIILLHFRFVQIALETLHGLMTIVLCLAATSRQVTNLTLDRGWYSWLWVCIGGKVCHVELLWSSADLLKNHILF